MAAVRLGVFGGTFDPPHLGHLGLAHAARVELGLVSVVWVPAGNPWRKEGLVISQAERRLEMLRLALEGEEGATIDTTELERAGPSYTVDTLVELHEKRPEAELVCLLGADALEDLPHWHEPERIIQLSMLGVTARSGRKPVPATLDSWLPGLSQRIMWFNMPRIDVSATEIRLRAVRGESLAGLVPEAVAAYIRRHKLYTAP